MKLLGKDKTKQTAPDANGVIVSQGKTPIYKNRFVIAGLILILAAAFAWLAYTRFFKKTEPQTDQTQTTDTTQTQGDGEQGKVKIYVTPPSSAKDKKKPEGATATVKAEPPQ